MAGNAADIKHLTLGARIFANQGKFDKAAEYCRSAIKRNKLDPELHYLYATVLSETGQPDEAAKQLRSALFLDHNFILAHFMLGNLYSQKDNMKTSKRHFCNVLRLLQDFDPKSVLPASEGMTAGRIKEVVEAIMVDQNTKRSSIS